MNTVKELLKRTVAVLILLTMIVSRLLMAGFGLVSYAIDNMRTSNENVEILAYFENEKGEKVVDIQERIDKPLNLKIDVVMKNTHGYGGYFDGDIEIANANFKLKDETEMKVHLNAGETTTIEREIEYLNPETNYEGYLNREATITVTGEYVNSKGNYEVEGTADVKVNWVSEENIEGRISGEVLTNKVYQEDKRIVQLLIDSKLENSSYPVKSVHEEIELPEGSENVKVHKRVATDVDKGIKYTTDEEQRKTIIEIEDTIEPIVVTYEIPNSVNLEEKKLETKGKITLYDGREIEANTEIEVKNEEKEGSITNKLIEKEEEIYKGKIYTGEKRQYSDAVKVYVDYIEAIEKIEIKDTKTVYVNEKNEETEANIRYESTVINKKEFDSILGETGYITVKDQEGNVIANINKETEVKENGNIVIEYGENTKNISIITSKPVSTGIFNIINNKKIEENKTREEIEKIVGIKEELEVNGKESEKIIKLKEPQTELGFNVEETRIEVGNKKDNVKMEIDLIGNSEEKELYKDPTIQIVFPEEVKNVQARYRMLYSNGLKIEKGIIQEQNGRKVLTFNIKGEQIKYPSQIEEGTKILIYSDLEIDEKANTGEKDIVLNYINNKTEQGATGTKTAKINIEEKTIPVVKRNMNLLGAPNTNTNEETGIKTTLEASVGNDILENNDEVKAGEVIRYRITVENTGTQDLEGVTITGQVPEGTTLVEADERPVTALVSNSGADATYDLGPDGYEYYNKKEDRTVTETKNISAGKSILFEYEVKVNNDIQDGATTTNTVITKLGEENKNTNEISHRLKSGDIELTMLPVLRHSINAKIESGKIYEYNLRIKNNSNEVKKNVEITINTNNIISIEGITLIVPDMNINKDIFDTNIVKIDTLNANSTAKIKVMTSINKIEEGSISIISGTANYDNNMYRSNGIYEETESVKYNISIAGSQDKEYLEPGDEIIYTINIKNTGELNPEGTLITEYYSKNLEIEEITLNNEMITGYESGEEGEQNYYKIRNRIMAGEEAELKIKAKLPADFKTATDIEISNKAIVGWGSLIYESNEIKYLVKANVEDEKPDDNTPDDNNPDDNNPNDENQENNNPDDNNPNDENQENNNPDDNNPNDENQENNNPEDDNSENNTENNNTQENNIKEKNISGVAWLDENRDGIRQENETTLSGIEVQIVNTETNEFVKDANGNVIRTQTGTNGVYTLNNIPDGKYIVIFIYDSNLYTTTTYKVDQFKYTIISCATERNINVNENNQKVGATDIITFKDSISNLNIGLVKIEKADLRLEKTVSKIVVNNKDGIKTYSFNDEDLAKIEIASRKISGSVVLIEYSIKVKNTGTISGFAKNIADYAPSALNFNEQINKGWYRQGNYIYNQTLADEEIKPGEEKVLTLKLNITMTKNNTGLFNNIAEITESSAEKDENDKGAADVIIGIRTGLSFDGIVTIICTIIALIIVAYIAYKKRKMIIEN